MFAIIRPSSAPEKYEVPIEPSFSPAPNALKTVSVIDSEISLKLSSGFSSWESEKTLNI